MFLLHNLPCICSHQISLVLLKTHIKQDNFFNTQEVTKHNPKLQTGWKPLLEWQYHLLDYKVQPHHGAADSSSTEQGKATTPHASSGPVLD